MNQDKKYKKALGEFLIIVVGVLTALAADEWRQGLKQAALEQALLEDLAKEFSANLEQINVISAYYEGLRADHLALAEVPLEEFQNLALEEATEQVSSVFQPRQALAPRTGVLRSVVDGGQLSQITDRHLRYNIAEWLRWLEIAVMMDEQEFKFFLEDWRSVVDQVRNGDLDPRLNARLVLTTSGSQAYFIGGYLGSLSDLREHTETILSQLTEPTVD